MKKNNYLTFSILLLILSVLFFSCDIVRVYTEDEFMNLGKSSGSSKDSSSSSSSNTELKEAQLVDPSYAELGYYIFSPVNIRKSNGELIYNGIDFNYDNDLNSIYDDANSGSLSSGYFRVVHEGTNVINGLTLTPIAKDLTNKTSPPANEIYIDPVNGQFILPRPVFWSKCEDIGNLLTVTKIGNATVNDANITPIYSGTPYAKYGNGLYNNSSTGYYYFEFKIIDSKYTCGTMDFWAYTNTKNHGHETGLILIRLAGSVYLHLGIEADTSRTRGSTIEWAPDNIISSYGHVTGLNHWYIIWDSNKNLESGKSVRIFLNGTEILSSTSTLNNIGTDDITVRLVEDEGYASIDNVKIWNHIVTQDPSWLYNSGNGREEALHIIYGQANDYNPSNDIKVGYFYK